MPKSIRILLADDHDIVRKGLRSVLEAQSDMQVVGEAADGRQAVALAKELSPDAVVIDITMPGLNGIEATRQIRTECPDVRILTLSMHSSRRFMAEVLKAGSSAYLLKECAVAELVPAIRAVMEGRAYLSPRVTNVVVDDYVRYVPTHEGTQFGALTAREREVLQLVAEGKTTKEAANMLKVSAKTIEAHRSQIMAKLRIHSVAGLTKFAVHEGLTPPEP